MEDTPNFVRAFVQYIDQGQINKVKIFSSEFKTQVKDCHNTLPWDGAGTNFAL